MLIDTICILSYPVLSTLCLFLYTELSTTLKKLNTGNGTAAKILNDGEVYKELKNTISSLNTLVDDVRLHPKRYINVSVFGKKEKSGPLLAPIIDTASSNKQ